MPLSRAVALLLVVLPLVTLAAPMARSQDESGPGGDPERGKIVYRQVGYCVNCHGWAGDGKAGTRLQAPFGPSLRETGLDTAGLTETIACGRPGTAMPYHDRTAYRDGRCYGMSLDDFDEGTAPVRGKTFSEADVANVVAYLQTHTIGRGEPTRAECVDFYENPDAAACRGMD